MALLNGKPWKKARKRAMKMVRQHCSPREVKHNCRTDDPIFLLKITKLPYHHSFRILELVKGKLVVMAGTPYALIEYLLGIGVEAKHIVKSGWTAHLQVHL